MTFVSGHSVAVINWKSDIFEITTINNDVVNLTYEPLEDSEFIFLNGICLTVGASYDYTISGDEISFNAGVLTNDGHIVIKYNY